MYNLLLIKIGNYGTKNDKKTHLFMPAMVIKMMLLAKKSPL